MSSKPRKSGKTLLVIACLMIFMCGMCGVVGALIASNSGDTSASGATDVADTGAGAGTKATAGLNTAVRDGKFEFVVTAVECGKATVGGAYLNKTAQGQFCVVSLSVTNIGDVAQTFFDANQKGYSSNGAEYSTDSTATLYLEGDTSVWLTEINPGNGVEGQIVFDIPQGAALATLELHDSAFSGGVTVTVG